MVNSLVPLSIFLLSFIFLIVCGLFEWKLICANFLSFVYMYMYCRWVWVSSCQEGSVDIQLNGLMPSHFCTCPKSRPRFPTSYVVVGFVRGVSSFCLY